MLAAVAKALEEVAVKKGLAQEEAAEWRHKYELERLRNAHLQRLLADNAAQGDNIIMNIPLQCLEASVLAVDFYCLRLSSTADRPFVCVPETALVRR